MDRTPQDMRMGEGGEVGRVSCSFRLLKIYLYGSLVCLLYASWKFTFPLARSAVYFIIRPLELHSLFI
jgi:hypothetical protein